MIQNQYSMLHREIEAEIVPFCIEHNISIQTYSVLEKGLLSGRYKRDNVVPKGDIREESKWFLPENIGIILDMIDGWKDLCEKYECTLADLAIAWTKQQPGITNVLVGARKPNHIAGERPRRRDRPLRRGRGPDHEGRGDQDRRQIKSHTKNTDVKTHAGIFMDFKAPYGLTCPLP